MALDFLPNFNKFRITIPGVTPTAGKLEVGNARSGWDAVNLQTLATLLGVSSLNGVTPLFRTATGKVLVAGTVTVADTAITASSIVIPVVTTSGGTVGSLKTSVVAGTSYTITSSSNTETSTVSVLIIG